MTDDTRTRAPLDVELLERQIDHERIARRAYEIYESRHRADGHAEEDWSRAVAEYAARSNPERTPFDRSGASQPVRRQARKARR